MKLDSFSSHAALRLRERTSMSPWVLAGMLDSGAVLNLGSKPGINKNHYLFYSKKDDDCFVAVVDNLVGTIVTVWLLEYQKNLGWAVSQQQKDQAKNLALEYDNRPKVKNEPLTAIVSAGHINEAGEVKVTAIGKSPIADLEVTGLFARSSNRPLKSRVTDALKEKGITGFTPIWVSVRFGNKNPPAYSISLTEDEYD